MKRFIYSLFFIFFCAGAKAQCDVPVIGTITQPSCSVSTGEVILNGLNSGGWTITALPDGTTFNGTGTSTSITGLTAGTTYTFTASDGVCTSSASADVVINNAPIVPSPPTIGTITQPTCTVPSGTVSLSGLPTTGNWSLESTDNSVQQTGTGGTTNSTNLNPGSTYNFQVTNSDGCISLPSADVVIDAIPGPPADVTASVTFPPTCADPTGEIEVSDPLGSTIQYTIDGNNYQASTTFTGLTPGSYTCYAKDNTTGCISQNPTTVTITAASNFPTLSTTAVQDVSCFGISDGVVGLIVSGGTSPFTYSWSPQVSDLDTCSNLPAGNYTVTVMDAGGCTSTVVFSILEPEQITIAALITNVNCDSSSYGSINTTAAGGTGDLSYSWNPSDQTLPNLDGLLSGSYVLTVTDQNGCHLADTFDVAIDGFLTLSVEPFVSSIKDGMSVNLSVTGAETYTWLDTLGTLDCLVCDSVIASPHADIFYVVEGTNYLGCTGTGLAKIYVSPVCYDLFVPNTFTPNGDHFNDELAIGGLKSDCVLEYLFEVYDRWGTNVFSTTDITEFWDGTNKGATLNSGAYYYRIHLLYWDQSVVDQSGNCNIVK